MAPDWDELGEKYEKSKKVLIGDVDCTVDANKDLCSRFDVTGYPTLKYFNPPDRTGEVYEGGRSLPELKKFVKTLKPACSRDTWGKCSAKQKKELRPYIDMGKEELTKFVEETRAEMTAAAEAHEALQKSLQEQYEASEKHAKEVKETKGPGLKLAEIALLGHQQEGGWPALEPDAEAPKAKDEV